MAIDKLKGTGYIFRVEVLQTDEHGEEKVYYTGDYESARAARNVGSYLSNAWGRNSQKYRVTKLGYDVWTIKEIPKTKAEAIRELAKTLD